jgi:hypothetical protein
VQHSHPTDDDLWCAITKNTNTMSTLFDQQFEAGTSALLQKRVTVVIDNLQREYLAFAAELRCRHSQILNSEMPSSIRSDQAA